MKKVIILSAFLVAAAIVACNNSTSEKQQAQSFDTTKLKTGDAYYQCSMHLEVISDKPGVCEKCGGMELEKKDKK